MRYFLVLSLIVFGSVDGVAQTTANNCTEYGGKSVPILQPGTRKFKIKAIVGVSSKTAREADYVEFCVMPSKDDEKPSTAGPAKLEIPVAGDVDRGSGTVSITHGELKGKTYAGISSAIEGLKKARGKNYSHHSAWQFGYRQCYFLRW